MIVMQSSISTVSNARKAGFAVLSHPCSHRGQKFAGPDEQAKLDRISSMFDPKFRWFPSKTPITSPLHPHYSHYYIDIPNFFVFVQFVHKDPIGSHRIPVLYTKNGSRFEARIAAVFRYLDPGGEGTVSLKAMGLLHHRKILQIDALNSGNRRFWMVLRCFENILVQSIKFSWLPIWNHTTTCH